MKKALIVEIGGSHSECIYSQAKFLSDSGYDLKLLCSENLRQRIEKLSLKCTVEYFKFGDSTASDWGLLRDLKRTLISSGECTVIFNTAGGNLVRNLLSFHYPGGLKFIGVLHDLGKLKESFTQKLINRKIRKYFVLNDYLKEDFAGSSKISLESFYPVFFPDYKKIELNKKNEELWICIPGNVEYSRRDYISLLDCLKNEKVNPNIKFILLGSSKHFNSDADDLKKKVNEFNLHDRFVFFDGFVEEDLFHSYIRECDLVMPLIHKSHPFFQEVNGLKISGTFNVAFAHKKPILCEDSFSKFEDFRENGIFYKMEDMIKLINKIADNKKIIDELSPRRYTNPKWSFEFQKEKYINFIEGRI